jgi:putative DNA primase/helicase
MLQDALYLASKGFTVFPVKAGEKGGKDKYGKTTQLLASWAKECTTDAETIKKWWTRWPDANICIHTGKSGIVVIDCDVKNGDGIDEFDALALDQGIDDNTVQVETPSGGLHIYYRTKEVFKNRNEGQFLPNVDVKSGNSYVLAPPSFVNGKRYTWDPNYSGIADIPEKLASLLKAKPKKTVKQEGVFRGEENSGRDCHLISFAGRLQAAGFSDEEIGTMVEAKNAGFVAPLPDSDVQKIVRSACGYEKGTISVRQEPKTATEPEVKIFNRTDLGNAERLIYHFGQDLRYCYRFKKWLVWDGKRWKLDEGSLIQQKAALTVRTIYKEAAAIADDEKRKEMSKHARSSEGNFRIKGMIELAEKDVAVSPDDLDQDRWLLNVENGTLDLRTGELRPHSRDDLITKICPVTYVANAACPEWITFLDRIMGSDDSLIGFLRRAIGYTLTGETSERCMFILHGTGDNGKSTLINAISSLLGDYSLRTPTQTLMSKRGTGVPNDVARLKGSRLVFAAESEEEQKLAEATIKDLTGNDTISARYMRAEWFDFKPECKIWFGTNHKPIIKGTDNAIWNRLKLVPFNVTIPDEEKDYQLEGKLKAELSGILNWALSGCLDWQRSGIGIPEAVKAAVASYRKESDAIGQFVSECCVTGSNCQVTVAKLYLAYKQWAHNSDEDFVGKRAFNSRLIERGHSKRKASANQTTWFGIGLVA